MHWKNTFLKSDSRPAVQDFIKRHLAGAGFTESLKIRVISTLGQFSLDVRMPDDSRILLLEMKDGGGASMDLEDLRAYWQARGLGSLGAKVGIMAAQLRGKSHVFVRNVQGEGKTFWPYFGTLSYTHPLVPKHFSDFLDCYHDECSFRERDTVKKLRDLSVTSYLNAWRGLALYDGKIFGGHYIRSLIFSRIPIGATQILLLGEKGTRSILVSRLGTLPPMRPVAQRFIYETTELAKEPYRKFGLGLS